MSTTAQPSMQSMKRSPAAVALLAKLLIAKQKRLRALKQKKK